MPGRRGARRRAETISVDQKTSQQVRDVLARVFRGEPKDGFLPTLEQRVHAAIALAPYYAPRILGVAPGNSPAWEQSDVDPKQLSENELTVQSYLLLMNETCEPSPRKATAGDGELPHAFLARVARGELIDGYLPPMRLQLIAAAAAALYYAPRLAGVNVQKPDEQLLKLLEEQEKRRSGLSRRPDPEEELRAATEVYKRLMEGI